MDYRLVALREFYPDADGAKIAVTLENGDALRFALSRSDCEKLGIALPAEEKPAEENQ